MTECYKPDEVAPPATVPTLPLGSWHRYRPYTHAFETSNAPKAQVTIDVIIIHELLSAMFLYTSPLCLGSSINLGVQLLLSLHGVNVFVGRSSVALGLVKYGSSSNGVFESLDLV